MQPGEAALGGNFGKPGSPGDWPTPRQNRCLNGVQPVPGRMTSAPKVAARLGFPKGQGALREVSIRADGPADHVIAIADGRLRCYHPDGKLRWETHPPGLNFESLIAAEDLDGDGRVELALTAGRPTSPLGAAVLIAADTGKLLFRYDVEPMSYYWAMQVDHFLPDGVGKQIVVCEHGYPPDARNGYIALFAFEKPGTPPAQRWRYDFDHYTCFPSLLMADVNGDGVNELCVETHSHIWVLDVRTGNVHQFLQWDVSPANVRSYGLVRFQDLNGDGLPDFFCIANFAQHHEVLLNDKGMLKRAWAHGWNDSVSTRTIATAYPDPPIADVDGDGRLEMTLSMFNAEGEPRWMIRVYDAATGVLKAKVLDRIAVGLIDIDGDGAAEILADQSTDPTRTVTQGACLLKWKAGTLEPLWQAEKARTVTPPIPTGTSPPLPEAVFVQLEGSVKRLRWHAPEGIRLTDEQPPASPAPPTFPHLPATVGPALEPPLVADVDGDGRNEVLHYHAGQATLYRYEAQHGFVKLGEYPSSGMPALADVDGDGRLELITGQTSPTADPVIQAEKIGKEARLMWRVTPARPDRQGLPASASGSLYFQTGRFLGRTGEDVYAFVSTPIARSFVLDGSNGALIWDKGKIPGIERYFAPTVNQASVWDFDGDGKDDLVFTCPDYYCVASGPTGDALIGPLFPPQIFQQPSQGLYTLPAILPQRSGELTVCLSDGHYFLAAMTLHAHAKWFQLPIVGQARAGAEGFLQMPEGRWLLGVGRQNGQFACLDAETGATRWEFPLQASASDICACDVDGDGRQEFVFGTSHGDLYALAEHQGRPHVVWKVHLSASVGAPVIADVDGDGASEILVTTGDGNLCLLRPHGNVS
jgi:hypothetical protein